MIPYEVYKKLRETPWDELSEEDKKKRIDELKRRLDLADKYLKAIVNGNKISEDIEKEIPDDDPLQEIITCVRIISNEKGGES